MKNIFYFFLFLFLLSLSPKIRNQFKAWLSIGHDAVSMTKPILPINEIKKQIQQLPAKSNEVDPTAEIIAPKGEGSEFLAKQYIKKLKIHFPARNLTESEETQIVSNLMQKGSKEGVFRSFIEDSSHYELLKTKRDVPSEKIKEFVRSLYLKYLFFDDFQTNNELSLLELQKLVLNDMTEEWEKLYSRDITLSKMWASHLTVELAKCAGQDDHQTESEYF
nr:hypothetical protein [Bacteriovoracaceae bacterium]